MFKDSNWSARRRGVALRTHGGFILETSLFSFLSRMLIRRDCIVFMADREYELYDITEFLRRPAEGALGQIDIAFVKGRGCFRLHARW
jgi:hypothetical protein